MVLNGLVFWVDARSHPEIRWGPSLLVAVHPCPYLPGLGAQGTRGCALQQQSMHTPASTYGFTSCLVPFFSKICFGNLIAKITQLTSYTGKTKVGALLFV